MDTGNILLGDIASKKNIGIPYNSTFKQAFQVMHKNGKGVVVVLDKHKPVGI